MKTVERKAKEYSEPIIYSYSDCRWCDAGELEEYIQDAYIAGYTEANKWISVEEELPDKNKRVLIKTNTELIYTGYWSGINFCEMFGCHPIDMVTHWRPIN